MTDPKTRHPIRLADALDSLAEILALADETVDPDHYVRSVEMRTIHGAPEAVVRILDPDLGDLYLVVQVKHAAADS